MRRIVMNYKIIMLYAFIGAPVQNAYGMEQEMETVLEDLEKVHAAKIQYGMSGMSVLAKLLRQNDAIKESAEFKTVMPQIYALAKNIKSADISEEMDAKATELVFKFESALAEYKANRLKSNENNNQQ